jgi:DNA-binding NtrC family response regulator/CHASE2 domain-containing sensor protein
MAVGGARITALEWSIYDHWVRTRGTSPGHPGVVVVARDAASEARLGAGPWDGALLARVVASLARAGALTIGIDIPLGRPGTPGRGGASSDAWLAEASARAGIVVAPIFLEEPAPRAMPAGTGAEPPAIVHPSWPRLSRGGPAFPPARPPVGLAPGLAGSARAIGHTLAEPDPDGVIRRIPLFVRLGDRAVPGFGLALAPVFGSVPADRIGFEAGQVMLGRTPRTGIPVDARGRALLGHATADLAGGVTVVPFLDLWEAIEAGSPGRVQALVGDRIVLVLTEPRSTGIPGGATGLTAHAQLLQTVLSGGWLREVPRPWGPPLAVALASLTAWLCLGRHRWTGAIAAAVLAAGYVAALPVCLSVAGLVLPAWPVAAMVFAYAGALLWNRPGAAPRLRRLEEEIEVVRDALVLRESAVEALEEDLEEARAAAARSKGAERGLREAADALRDQLAGARAKEEETRRRLLELETAIPHPAAAGNAGTDDPGFGGSVQAPRRSPGEGDIERERLQAACERLGIVSRDAALLAVFRDLEKAARASLPILIGGEPGTGKELFARAAHHLGPRASQPFVAVNVAAIPAGLFEGEMFGHVKGGFTGAAGDRKGFLEQADGGTIFLDEVGELPPEHQAKLLRALQEGSFHRVGAARPTTVDVRVVTASNRDLERGVAEGWFRQDLYFRLKGLVLHLPPLRERREDLPLLAARFVEEAAAEHGRTGLALSREALGAIASHGWPGNVRELQHCLRRAVALADGPLITPEDLRLAPSSAGPPTASPPAESDDAGVLACLRQHGFDMQATARALGCDRSTVTQRLKGLGFQALVQSGGDPALAARVLAGEGGPVRTVELKLREYHEHLVRSAGAFDTPDAAIVACRRRFKNLPERHFPSLEILVRRHFELHRPAAKT